MGRLIHIKKWIEQFMAEAECNYRPNLFEFLAGGLLETVARFVAMFFVDGLWPLALLVYLLTDAAWDWRTLRMRIFEKNK